MNSTSPCDLRQRVIDSPVGPLTLVASATALTGLHFGALDLALDAAASAGQGKEASGPAAILDAAQSQLTAYFAGERQTFDLPLAPEGTAFQQRVWTALRGIGYGETCSYAEIARRIGAPRAVRAVGVANGRNPIAIIVPCHRVIGARGDLVGFGGGLPIKAALLALEQPALWAAHAASLHRREAELAA